jgi:hypothetical protein
MTPMRTVVLLLVLANLTFFVYTRLDSTREGEDARLAEQVQPDKIRLLTPQQVAALGPSKVAALADVCLEWGPIAEGDRARAFAELEPLALGRLLTQRRVETNTAFCPSSAGGESGRSRATRRGSPGARHRRRVDRRQRPATPRRSLGAFVTEEAAKARLAALANLGVANAALGPREQVVVSTHFVIRDPQAPVIARVRDLAPAYPGSEAKIGNCDKAQ